MVGLRKFNRNDSDAWSGAEGDPEHPPLIGEVGNFTILCDTAGVQVVDGRSGGGSQVLTCDNYVTNKVIATGLLNLGEEAIENEYCMFELGFEELES